MTKKAGILGNREETTERILEAALAVLAEEGFAALGINGLARRAGADKQLIYRYFGGLDGVLAALGQKVADRLTTALAAQVQAPGSYGELAEGMLVALLRHLRGDAEYRQLRLMEVVAPSQATAAFRAARGRAMAEWVAARAAGLAPPEAVDVGAVNAVLIAAVEGLAVLGAVGVSDADRVEAAVRALVQGVYGGESRGGPRPTPG